MPRVLISGGTGVLGRELAPRFAEAGYTVRIMSRRPRPPDAPPDLEWAGAQLDSGEGLAGAVAGVDAIAHCASSPFRHTGAVDVEGTGRLLTAARDAGVSHFLYISIVGIDRIPLPYYKHKLAAERLIEASGVPYSVLRAPQFHTLVDRIFAAVLRLPVGLYPAGFRFQPVDPGEVAERMVQCAQAGPAGRLPDLGGPEVWSVADLARTWLKATGKRRLLLPLPLFGKVASGFRRGFNTAPENAYGEVTWPEWLRRRYGGPT